MSDHVARPGFVRDPDAGNDPLDAFVRHIVVEFGLRGAAVLRILPDAIHAVTAWPRIDARPLTRESTSALTDLAHGPRGVAIWHSGSSVFRDLVELVEGEGLRQVDAIVAVRMTTPNTPVPEIVIALASQHVGDGLDLARGIARAHAPRGASARMEVGTNPRATALLDISLDLAGELEMDRLLPAVAAAARDLFDARYVAVGVIDPSGTGIEHFHTIGMDAATQARIGRLPAGKGLLGVLLDDPRPVRLTHISDDARSVGFPSGHPPMESFLGVPMLLAGVLVGNLYMTEKHHGLFSEDDEQLAMVFAAQAAVAIENARRFAIERARIAAFEHLETTMQSIRDALADGLETHRALDAVFDDVVARVGALTGSRGVCIARVEEGDLVVHAANGVPGIVALLGQRIPRGAGDLASEFGQRIQLATDVLELRIGDELAGILVVAGERPADPGAIAILQAVASQLALAIANERARVLEAEQIATTTALSIAKERERSTAEGFRRAIRAQEAERARIARELHDEAGQVMMAVALHLRALEQSTMDANVRARIEELHAIVSESSLGLHELISDLRPGPLREYGLAAAIEQHAVRTHDATGIEVGIHLDALPALPEEIELALYRVVQEALSNVARHSGASTASVTAARTGRRLRLVIDDNGRGFDPVAATTRHGLLGMSERMALLGGTLYPDARPGGGTAVIAELDLDAAIIFPEADSASGS